jgi:hypothetical protein
VNESLLQDLPLAFSTQPTSSTTTIMHISFLSTIVTVLSLIFLPTSTASPISPTDPTIPRFEHYRSLLIEYAYPGLQERARLQERGFPRFRPGSPDSQSSPPPHYEIPNSHTNEQNPHCQTSSCQDSDIRAPDFPDPSGGQQSEDDTEDNDPGGEDQSSAAGRNGTASATGGTDGTKKNGKRAQKSQVLRGRDQ